MIGRAGGERCGWGGWWRVHRPDATDDLLPLQSPLKTQILPAHFSWLAIGIIPLSTHFT